MGGSVQMKLTITQGTRCNNENVEDRLKLFHVQGSVALGSSRLLTLGPIPNRITGSPYENLIFFLILP